MALNVNIRSSECAWANFELKMLGHTIRGLRAISFSRNIEKEHVFGAGQSPLDINAGNITPEGSITVLGFEYDNLTRAANLAGYPSICEVPHEAIVITAVFQKRRIDPIKRITITGVSFTEDTQSLDQNAKYMEVSLPFLAMEILTIAN